MLRVVLGALGGTGIAYFRAQCAEPGGEIAASRHEPGGQRAEIGAIAIQFDAARHLFAHPSHADIPTRSVRRRSRRRYRRRYSFGIFGVAYVFLTLGLFLNFSAGRHLLAVIRIPDLLAALHPVLVQHRAMHEVVTGLTRDELLRLLAEFLERGARVF